MLNLQYDLLGKRIIPQPNCKCGNIPFFDITEFYVRFSKNWPVVKVLEADNWREEVLGQVTENGKPSFVFDIDSLSN